MLFSTSEWTNYWAVFPQEILKEIIVAVFLVRLGRRSFPNRPEVEKILSMCHMPRREPSLPKNTASKVGCVIFF